MNFITVNGSAICYSDSPNGVPFLWMHGLMMNREVDEQLRVIDFDELHKKCRLIRVDAPGHGSSMVYDNADDYKWERLSDIYSSILNKHKIDSSIVGGFSMGSAAAIHFACKYPERTKALVLTMPPKIWDDRPEQQEAYTKMACLSNNARFPKMLPRLISETPVNFVEEAFRGSQRKVSQIMSSLAPSVYFDLFTAAAQSDYPSKSEVAKLNMPILILGWRGDDTHPLNSIKQLQELLPNANVHIAKNMDELRSNSQILQEFIAEVEAPVEGI